MSVIIQKLNAANEQTWMQLGKLCELMNDTDKALFAYENVLRHNHFNVTALRKIASVYRSKDQFSKAVEYYQRALNVESNNCEIWGALGHCFLMMDDLQKAYTAYHQALYNAKLQNAKHVQQDPHLWYGIGILYERYGSLENAEEAFTSVLKKDPNFEKSNEIYFRLGIVYKQQCKYDNSLECFGYILDNPPSPLSQGDIWFQIGHVYELKKDYMEAKRSYEKVLQHNANHAKVLQQLGWLYHQNTPFNNQDIAISYLRRSIDADSSDGQTWYLLGRCYMAQQKYRAAYDAYQQAVFRDGRNPTFWCSIGVLYYQINQYRDALDAYSRAIRLNPYLSEVWYDLGTLYESCSQLSDALDAYQRAAELDPNNKHIQQRLSMLRAQAGIKSGHKQKYVQYTHHDTNRNRPQTLAPLNVPGDPQMMGGMRSQPVPYRNDSIPAAVPIQPKSQGPIAPSFQELTRQNSQMKKQYKPDMPHNGHMEGHHYNPSSIANLNNLNRGPVQPPPNTRSMPNISNFGPMNRGPSILNSNSPPIQGSSLNMMSNDFKQYQYESRESSSSATSRNRLPFQDMNGGSKQQEKEYTFSSQQHQQRQHELQHSRKSPDILPEIREPPEEPQEKSRVEHVRKREREESEGSPAKKQKVEEPPQKVEEAQKSPQRSPQRVEALEKEPESRESKQELKPSQPNEPKEGVPKDDEGDGDEMTIHEPEAPPSQQDPPKSKSPFHNILNPTSNTSSNSEPQMIINPSQTEKNEKQENEQKPQEPETEPQSTPSSEKKEEAEKPKSPESVPQEKPDEKTE